MYKTQNKCYSPKQNIYQDKRYVGPGDEIYLWHSVNKTGPMKVT